MILGCSLTLFNHDKSVHFTTGFVPWSHPPFVVFPLNHVGLLVCDNWELLLISHIFARKSWTCMKCLETRNFRNNTVILTQWLKCPCKNTATWRMTCERKHTRPQRSSHTDESYFSILCSCFSIFGVLLENQIYMF